GKALYACSLEEERRYAAEGAEQRGREPASRPTRALVGRGERGRRRVRAPLSLATSLLVDARPGLCRPVRAPLPAGASVLAGRCEHPCQPVPGGSSTGAVAPVASARRGCRQCEGACREVPGRFARGASAIGDHGSSAGRGIRGKTGSFWGSEWLRGSNRKRAVCVDPAKILPVFPPSCEISLSSLEPTLR